jgi:catalase
VASASTAGETSASPKTGDGVPPAGTCPAGQLDRVRADSGEQRLTTNQGVPVADNQNSLKVGLRGPTAMEDFILREKITHFDHERIPERVVHARGSAAHGYFESYQDLSALTRAAPFAAAGKRTPVFVRFSTVAGERGSADTVRDVRGFAVKFYTDEGNWDLVGNNMPVFFIQDAMKFPDLVHAVKPEPHHGMPQAASAHDTFWDFVSLMPESTHMLMWHMSDRAIPRSYRTMQGFGVHTFRLVNAAGESVFCKFHWNPAGGTHSLVWDEAARIIGADPDFHRRDLWEAIEAGAYPEWELGCKSSPKSRPSGSRSMLDPPRSCRRNWCRCAGRQDGAEPQPDNFFAETEQVAFCTAHIVPGIDFSNDPLLQGAFTRIWTRRSAARRRQLPRDSDQRAAGAGAQQPARRHAPPGRASRPRGVRAEFAGRRLPVPGRHGRLHHARSRCRMEDKVRGKPELFADHYSQARCSGSASPAEQAHIVNAFRFELTKVQTPAIRVRLLSMLANVDPILAEGVAQGLGSRCRRRCRWPPMRRRRTSVPSPALSLLARPGVDGIKTRKVAILATHGVDAVTLKTVYADLLAAGAVPRVVAPQLGSLQTGRRPAGCRDLHRSRSGGGVRRADRGDGASAACCKAMPTRVNSCACNTATASRSSRWARARTSSGGRVADGVPDPALWCGRRRCPRQGTGELSRPWPGIATASSAKPPPRRCKNTYSIEAFDPASRICSSYRLFF